jgi:hypothetical protein
MFMRLRPAGSITTGPHVSPTNAIHNTATNEMQPDNHKDLCLLSTVDVAENLVILLDEGREWQTIHQSSDFTVKFSHSITDLDLPYLAAHRLESLLQPRSNDPLNEAKSTMHVLCLSQSTCGILI